MEFKKDKIKAEKIIEKFKMWKTRYNNCSFNEEHKMDVKVIDWKMKAEIHEKKLKNKLGDLRICFDNDRKRLELAKILKMYEDGLRTRRSSQ